MVRLLVFLLWVTFFNASLSEAKLKESNLKHEATALSKFPNIKTFDFRQNSSPPDRPPESKPSFQPVYQKTNPVPKVVTHKKITRKTIFPESLPLSGSLNLKNNKANLKKKKFKPLRALTKKMISNELLKPLIYIGLSILVFLIVPFMPPVINLIFVIGGVVLLAIGIYFLILYIQDQ